MNKPYIGPLDKVVYDAMMFSAGMATCYFITTMLKQIESLTSLLEDERLEGAHKKATEILLQQLEQNFYDHIEMLPDEDSNSGRTHI